MIKRLGKIIPFGFITILFAVGIGLLVFTKPQPVIAQSNSVCPGGDGVIDSEGWIKFEAEDPGQSENLITYTADPGYIITEICIKGGQEGANEGGYKVNFTSDGWYQVEGVNCVGAFGIGTQSGEARRNSDISGNICSGMSHTGFKVEEEETPEPTETTETPEPTETTETPEPTETTETPEPTETTETPEPTETTETPEPTETTETPEPTETTETPEPTETTETPEPTEPPIQPDPDLGVGDWIPFIAAGIGLLLFGGILGYLQAQGKLPLKKFF